MSSLASSFGADSYLAVQTSRAGAIKGESQASGHVDEIVVRGWQWGMSSNTDAASRGQGGAAAARRSLRPLIVEKSLDRASTALMAAVAINDKVKSAVLTMRKSGDAQQDFFKMTLSGAVLMDINCAADESGRVIERLTFSYAKLEVEYRVQQAGGQLGGASTFDVEA